MSNCCSNSCGTPSVQSRGRCPINGKEYAAVSAVTIKHHIREPWRWRSKDQAYYFCTDPECAVVYFGQDASIVEKTALRTAIGIKEHSEDSMLCYCFGIMSGEALNNPELKAFVVEETKRNECACEIRNPSGKCCLGEFAKLGKR